MGIQWSMIGLIYDQFAASSFLPRSWSSYLPYAPKWGSQGFGYYGPSLSALGYRIGVCMLDFKWKKVRISAQTELSDTLIGWEAPPETSASCNVWRRNGPNAEVCWSVWKYPPMTTLISSNSRHYPLANKHFRIQSENSRPLHRATLIYHSKACPSSIKSSSATHGSVKDNQE
jgi:hypothetical protein